MKKMELPTNKTNQGNPALDEPPGSKTTLAAERNESDQANHKFKAMLNSLLVPVTLITDEYKYEWVNNYFATTHGKKTSDIIGKTVSDLWGKKTFEMYIMASIDRCLDGHAVKQEGWMKFTALGNRYCETVYSPFHTHGEDRASVIVVTYDITERKRAEQQLRNYQEHLEKLVEERMCELKESEEKFRNIFEDAVVGIYQSTPEGRFLMANPALARMYGYETPEELVRTVTDIANDIYFDPERRKDFIALAEADKIVGNFEIQVRTRNGLIRYVSVNAHTVKDGNGKTKYYEGIVQDITEKKLVSDQVILQRDLAVKLAQTDDIWEGLHMILQAAIKASGMECGGISLKNGRTGGFDLIHSVGLSKDFQKKIQHVQFGSFTWSRMMEKKSSHMSPTKEQNPIAFEEGFQFASVMPMLQGDEVLGLIVVASKIVHVIPEHVRIGLEGLAAESGNVIARMQARQRLEEEIKTRREAEYALQVKSQSLEEANTALKVLLKHREDDRKELEEKFVGNVRQLVMPYVEKLKSSKLEPFQQMAADFIDSNLNEIISPFLNNIRSFHFTPRQLEIISLIKAGKTTKEIAPLLAVSKDAIDLQRFLIRKKLGINNNKANLRSYLLALA